RLFYQGNEFDKKNKSMDPVFTDPVFGDYLKSWMPQGLTDSDYEVAQYDGAIAYMDTCIQQIFLKLEPMGIMDDTIVILNGDHGETLYDHDCWFDHHGLYDVTLKVPLMIRYPEKLPAGKRISGYNTHKDLLPTILELAGLKTDIKFDGESLMKLVTGKKESFESSIYITECTWMRKHGLRTPQWKLIVALEPDFHGKPEVELYNLIEDPDENKNVAKKFPEVVACLRAEMEKHIAKREKETGLANPMHNQPHWHGNQDIDYFESSSQAADVLYIGSVAGANKLQNKKAK
ncbi:MAG: sulfatase-like hydrolase/transferase, partial [Lentisphaeria bacterium]|nr:sulfatase-like hydrolase/transferase [Lentisphaeria bacterium]